jgi:hypothetical protein
MAIAHDPFRGGSAPGNRTPGDRGPRLPPPAGSDDGQSMRKILAALVTLLALATAAGTANAAGTSAYAVDGGTAREQAQVRAALAASTFDWSLLPQQVTVHIGRGSDSFGTPGHVWLDADLLDSGRFSWGTVQHEFAHQIDFQLLDDAGRVQLQALLGGADWCYETAGLRHDQHACERFAETVAAAYWVSPANTATAAVPAARFRAALDGLLGIKRTLAAVRR